MNNQQKLWLGLAVGMALWASVFYNQLRDFITNNSIAFFLIFTTLFTIVVMKFVLHKNPLKEPRLFVAFMLVWLAFDVIQPPFMVTPQGLASQDPYVNVSSDVFLYKLFNLSGEAGYYAVYVIAPLAMLFIAMNLVKPTAFNELVRTGV